MDVECEIKFEPEQREAGDELALDPAERPSVVRGRPFAKGQSGNPAGRPARLHSPGTVAEYLIGRKTVPLTKKAVELALAGDKTMLRLCLAHIAPLQKGASEWLGLGAGGRRGRAARFDRGGHHRRRKGRH